MSTSMLDEIAFDVYKSYAVMSLHPDQDGVHSRVEDVYSFNALRERLGRPLAIVFPDFFTMCVRGGVATRVKSEHFALCFTLLHLLFALCSCIEASVTSSSTPPASIASIAINLIAIILL
mmetsp:Transcript_7100/g.10221  ORF Transcript_7100/g.10221 Transcript_7100/m.10221 type:complete len:120 (+) Transcript_7100:528-887(+)